MEILQQAQEQNGVQASSVCGLSEWLLESARVVVCSEFKSQSLLSPHGAISKSIKKIVKNILNSFIEYKSRKIFLFFL